MRITRFRIENFRSIRLAECNDPPDFVVICGGNGCGKSALLEAIMTAKEYAGSYGSFQFDPRSVMADADRATISMTIAFSAVDRAFVETQWSQECPESDDIVVEIQRGGQARVMKRSGPTKLLFPWYSRTELKSPGFFDYIDAHRFTPKKSMTSWSPTALNDRSAKQNLAEAGSKKFAYTKEYLTSLKIRDLQELDRTSRAGHATSSDSLKLIREFFDSFFSPMTFKEVRIDTPPFEFVIGTPHGEIDIDDLSGGEKEVLNVFVRFHQLDPKKAIILFDEADAHLHPDLERRYLEVLRGIGEGNQLWLTTHSPEMMIAAGADSLYTILKEPPTPGANQFVKVSGTDELHGALAEVMGSRGLVSFNQRIVFIEGEESSADREIYEKWYPPSTHNVSFIPAGNSATVRKTAERVNELLSSSMLFQYYFSIVDGDIERALPAPLRSGQATSRRLHKLPVYHVENLLLNSEAIFQVVKDMKGSECPYHVADDVESALKGIVADDVHLKPFTAALLDARLAKIANAAREAVYKDRELPDLQSIRPSFAEIKAEAKAEMETAIADGTWKNKCKGREVLRAFCGKHGLKYIHFRNCVLAKIGEPPAALSEIMDKILGT